MLLNGGISRRDMLAASGTGLGVLGLAGLLAGESKAASVGTNPLAPKVAHFPAKAKHVIHLFMNGGPSQVDTFDPKPALDEAPRPDSRRRAGPEDRAQDRRAVQVAVQRSRSTGSRGIEVSEIFPEVGVVHRRHLRHPLDAHEHPEPRAGVCC